MSRLIDVDAFKEYICNSYEQVKHMYPDGGEWARQITEDFCKDIDEQPTIDISNNSNTLGVLDCVERQAAIEACTDRNGICIAKQRLLDLPSVQPETAKRIVGKSRDGMTLWYQCDMCNEPVDEQDNYCRGCGRRLIDE